MCLCIISIIYIYIQLHVYIHISIYIHMYMILLMLKSCVAPKNTCSVIWSSNHHTALQHLDQGEVLHFIQIHCLVADRPHGRAEKHHKGAPMRPCHASKGGQPQRAMAAMDMKRWAEKLVRLGMNWWKM